MSMFTERLTIAIPVFERKEFFEAAVNSVLNQSCRCKLVVVDNASSHSFFRDYCELHNIPYYRNSMNIGMFGNWNRCFEVSDTDFVMVLGDDDLLDADFVQEFVSALTRYPDL